MQDFIARLTILQHYKFIDNDQNLLFKGRVAKSFSNIDQILGTQLLFSGWLTKLTIEEICALFSIMRNEIKAGKDAKMNETNISENFKGACYYLEKECQDLIEIEQNYAVPT